LKWQATSDFKKHDFYGIILIKGLDEAVIYG